MPHKGRVLEILARNSLCPCELGEKYNWYCGANYGLFSPEVPPLLLIILPIGFGRFRFVPAGPLTFFVDMSKHLISDNAKRFIRIYSISVDQLRIQSVDGFLLQLRQLMWSPTLPFPLARFLTMCPIFAALSIDPLL